MNPKKAFEEKYFLVEGRKEKDPSLSAMAEVLAASSQLSGKQRTYCTDKYAELYSKKFSVPTVVNRNGTMVWQLFASLSNKVLMEGYKVPKEEEEVIKTILDIGQKCTVEGTVLPSISADEKNRYTTLTKKYLSGSGKMKKEVKAAVDEIAIILPM